jgi:hypothetical protein
VQFDVSELLRADRTARFTAYRTGIVGMFMKPNQARREPRAKWAAGWEDPKRATSSTSRPTSPRSASSPGGHESGPGSDVTGGPAAGGRGDPAAFPKTPPSD